MRINIYSQELILPVSDEECGDGSTLVIERIAKVADTGIAYHAVRQYLRSPACLHATADDDDRSATTWWLPKSSDRREMLARQFEELADLVRTAPPETGLD